jgi:hypothetical protein
VLGNLLGYPQFGASTDFRSPQTSEGKVMSPTTTEAVATELKRFAQELNLTDSQREELRTYLADIHTKVQDFLQKNPNIERSALREKVRLLRSTMRAQLIKFLTPGQLAKWDAEVATAKEFLGQSVSQ